MMLYQNVSLYTFHLYFSEADKQHSVKSQIWRWGMTGGWPCWVPHPSQAQGSSVDLSSTAFNLGSFWNLTLEYLWISPGTDFCEWIYLWVIWFHLGYLCQRHWSHPDSCAQYLHKLYSMGVFLLKHPQPTEEFLSPVFSFTHSFP